MSATQFGIHMEMVRPVAQPIANDIAYLFSNWCMGVTENFTPA